MTPIRRFKLEPRLRIASARAFFADRRRRHLALGIGVVVLFFGWPVSSRLRSPEYSRLVQFSDGTLLRAYLAPDEKWRFPVDSRRLPKHVTAGLVCLEDRRFFHHAGVDPFALLRALAQDVRHGRIVSGGSTLTMQVARMAARRPRTVVAKALEILEAVRLETHFSKRRLMDLYLTYAPFGANIEGIEAAAERYFEKPARLLSSGEAAFLYLLPQSPHRWDRKAEEDLRRLRSRVLERWEGCRVLSREERERAEREPIPRWRPAFRELAPHFADWAVTQHPERRILRTTLSADVQRSVERLLAMARERVQRLGVRNVGVIVADNHDGRLVALVGNFDYGETAEEQKIPSFLAFRSPGSLLKPFFYAKLLEAGDVLPETLLEDVPVDYDDYDPKNYDGTFSGLVEARLALAHSLNVPWVKKLREVGLDSLLSFLYASGMETSLDRTELGLSSIIGAMETTMLDLTRMYRALADHGRIRPLTWLAGERIPDGWQWMHPGAAALTQEALSIRGRPDFGIDAHYLADSTVRWKTGTSQGRRDAWAFGFDADFTVGVWLGNLDNEPSPGLVGPQLAAPLMFDTFTRLRRHVSAAPLAPLVDARLFDSVETCAFSGLPPGPACPTHRSVTGIRGVTVRHRCPFHVESLVDGKSGYRINRECVTPAMEPVVRSFLALSPDVNYWATKSFPNLALSPAYHPRCPTRAAEAGKIRIVTPESTTYLLHSGLGRERITLPLKVKTADLSDQWRCYLNGNEVHRERTEFDPVLQLRPGDYQLFCVDQLGRSDRVAFAIAR